MAGVTEEGDMTLRVIVPPNCLAFCRSLGATSALVYFPYNLFPPPKKWVLLFIPPFTWRGLA